MQGGETGFAATPGGDRPVLVLTRDPVGDRRLAQACWILRDAVGC
jgi:mRNA-degrading endonuclease toxin of MazEF toxin-antitoxin module